MEFFVASAEEILGEIFGAQDFIFGHYDIYIEGNSPFGAGPGVAPFADFELLEAGFEGGGIAAEVYERNGVLIVWLCLVASAQGRGSIMRGGIEALATFREEIEGVPEVQLAIAVVASQT